MALEENHEANWIIGFSGGKDSSAMLKVLIAAANKAKKCPKSISVVYCDTGVENPLLDHYLKSLFKKLTKEFEDKKLPFCTKILRAPISDRFFVKVIGRGYPTPTNKFRWCTDKLRVRPVDKFIQQAATQDAIVCLGIRKHESQQRDRTLNKFDNKEWQNKNKEKYNYRMYLPILNFSIEDVWDVIFVEGNPKSLNPIELETIYRNASGECPIIKEPTAAPCGTGRFGCWTCTVVRKDKSMTKLIESGHTELEPYLDFRNWIAQFRDEPKNRWKKRRNGVDGLGPLTLAARKEILQRLDELSITVGQDLISKKERAEIHSLWLHDQKIEANF